ncbi:MAG TPA: FAD-dependent oxidoreductase, partial [Acidobacteriota bacterium]|nr:FAD-dependent oxidoreductase [Acidobacteriota bacterium]
MSARDRSFDVCVVGAGVMGLSASHELALRGARVLCVEKGEPGRGATGATAGTLAVQNKRSGSVPLALHAVADWQEMSSRLDHDVEYERRGGVRVADDARSREKLERSAAEQAELGATVEMVEPPDLFELAPYLARSTIAATYCPEDGMANPFATVRGYLDACTRTGNVTFRHGERVSSLEPTDGSSFVVHLDDERIHCGSVLVAVGASI